VRLTAAEYQDQLRALLPQGAAWPRAADSVLASLLLGWSEELARIDGRAWDLLEEIDPRTTTELIAEWERICGLPDPCSGLAPTLQGRRDAVLAKLTGRGGQSRAFYIALAAAFGFAITIEEFDLFTVGDTVGMSLTGDPWRFAWLVRAPEVTVREFAVGQSTAGEPLRSGGNHLLECVLTRLKPAHTHVIFAYGS